MKEIAESNVLVVDDNETNVDILVDTLGDFYDVSVAMDGLAALEAVEENPPDLILLDIMMPGLDGYEVCQRLKANQKTRKIPVIFVTAKVQVEDEIRGFECGAVDYITKPISPPMVKARVETHLKLRRSEQYLKELLEKTLDRHPRVGYELLCKIPNLREVAEIVARQQNPDINTDFKGNDEARKLVHVGSRILKLALDYEKLVFKGESSEAALSTLKSNEREYTAELLGQFSPIVEGESSHGPIRQLRANELSPGMIIHQDILTDKGKLLIEAGTEVNLPVYETLHNSSRTGFIQEPFQVLVPELGKSRNILGHGGME